jgi:hypothetical protein
MVEKGNILLLSDGSDETKTYVVLKRLEDMGRGEGGWLCVNQDALIEKGVDNISAFDCWRISDRYLKMQMYLGVITIAK